MLRDKIPPPSGMTAHVDWGTWGGEPGFDEGNGFGLEATGADEGCRGVPKKNTNTCSCPICNLDLTSWTIPDRETHADACYACMVNGSSTSRTPHDAYHAHTNAPLDVTVALAMTSDPTNYRFAGLPNACAFSNEKSSSSSPDAWLAAHGLARHTRSFTRECIHHDDLFGLTKRELTCFLGMSDVDAEVFLDAAARDFAEATRTAKRGANRSTKRSAAGNNRSTPGSTLRSTTGNSGNCGNLHSGKTHAELQYESMEQHDDEWTQLAMAMSESARDAAMAAPTANATNDGNLVSIDARRDTPRGAGTATTNLRENQENKPVAHSPCIQGIQCYAQKNSNRNGNEHVAPDDGCDEIQFVAETSALAAARVFGRRSVPSTLWGAAGHGGRDRVIPQWVLGGGMGPSEGG